jgi:hypothetical protein
VLVLPAWMFDAGICAGGTVAGFVTALHNHPGIPDQFQRCGPNESY